jgi:hypothetical protein
MPSNYQGDGSTLNLDFTTGVLDPRLSFSRASTATFVNSSGYVQFANANLIKNSENCGSWVAAKSITDTANAAISPNGTLTADQLNLGSGDYFYQLTAITNPVGQRYVGSVWMRTVSGTASVGLRITNNTTGSNSSITTCSVTETWQRFNTSAFTLTDTANRQIDVGVDQRSIVSGPNVSANIYIWGLQLQPGASVGEYLPTTTTESYSTPRFDYSPTNIGEPRGLLVEGQTVNLCRRSIDFNNTVTDGTNWNGSAYTIGVLSTQLPDGSTGDARRISIASAGGSFRSAGETVVASTVYTFSFYARNNGGSQARYRVWNVTAGSSIVDYTLSGSNYVSQIGGANNTSSTWVRVSVTFTTPVGCTSVFVYPASSDSGSVDLLVYGAQLELGSGASSLIPTGASGVTRNADNCLMTGTNFSSWFNNTEGTCLFVGDNLFVPAASNFATNWSFSNAANGQRIHNYTRHTNGRLGASARDSGGTALTFDSPWGSSTNITTTAVYKTAFALKTNDFAYSVNGNTAGLGDGNGVFETVTSIEFGRDGIRNGHIKQFKFFPTRLPNAQLQTLTAP